MIDLERHIELLLLHNDCVIVPEFGGFMAHRMPARVDKADGTLLPPFREVGFNPHLTMNDSLLAQSYAETYDISYPEALTRIGGDVEELRQLLERDGEYDLNGIGSLSLSAEGNLVFTPCEAGLPSPELYGLGGVVLPTLAELSSQKQAAKPENQKKPEPAIVMTTVVKPKTEVPADEEENDRKVSIRVSTIRNLIAAALVAIAFLLLPSRMDNGTSKRMAQSKADTNLLQKVMPQAETHMPAISPVGKAQSKPVKAEDQKAEAKEETVSEKIPEKVYCIVVASKVSKSNALQYISRLQANGVSDARIYRSKSGQIKVVCGKYETENEARKQLRTMADNEEFKDAWTMCIANN